MSLIKSNSRSTFIYKNRTMEKSYLTIVALLLATASFGQNGTLPNAGFENWSTNAIYDYTTSWFCSNEDDWRGVEATSQSTDAAAGLYSCELSAQEAGQDTVFGFVLHGTIGQNGPSGGISYSDAFDEVQFQYKSDLQTGDTLFLLAIRFTGGVETSSALIEAAVGTQSAWTAGSVSIPAGSQDALFIGFVLGNPFSNNPPTPGSWARIDQVAMYNAGGAVTNLPDPGFEDWTTQSVETPDSWYTMNEQLVGLNLENVTKTTDANSGSFAVELTTVEDPVYGDTISAVLSLGDLLMSGGNPFSPVPYNASPATFTCNYKYAPSGMDGATITIDFLSAGASVGSAFIPINNAATWTPISFPINLSMQPDSMVFVVFSGSNPGSVLILDDVSLSGGNVSLAEFETMDVSIYPNPATTSVMLKAEGNYSYAIVDLAGNVVKNGQMLSGATQVTTSDLSSGTYIINISNATTTETHKLIIQ